MSIRSCILTTKDYTILEVMLERRAPGGDAFAGLLRSKLETATIVFRDDVPPDVVTLGSRVAYRVGDADPETRIVSHEAMPSPVGLFLPVTTLRGLALLGLAEGQELSVPAAGAADERVVVETVLYQPEAARREKEARARLETPAARRGALRIVPGGVADAPAAWTGLARGPAGGDDPGPSAA